MITKKRAAMGALIVFFVLVIMVTYVNRNSPESDHKKDKFTIVTTFTILEDFAQNIAGNKGDVRVISPRGAEVHEWELLPENFIDLEQADIVFYNGLNVEQWMDQVQSAVSSEIPVIAVGEVCDYPRQPIVTGDFAGEPDPHIWMDVQGAICYVQIIRDKLQQHNPDLKKTYQKNSHNYIQKLNKLDNYIEKNLNKIPPEKRLLITTEAAFVYFSEAYNLEHNGIWGTNTEQEGTPGQIKRIMDLIEEKKPPALFWESTGSDRYVKNISRDTDIPVSGPLYVDSVGKSDSKAETYIKMMKKNTRLLKKVYTDKNQESGRSQDD
ncbi:MAG: metal ABC transporter solute-binding protein, Zn/Mn family [Halanaerobiaceae bacterium]